MARNGADAPLPLEERQAYSVWSMTFSASAANGDPDATSTTTRSSTSTSTTKNIATSTTEDTSEDTTTSTSTTENLPTSTTEDTSGDTTTSTSADTGTITYTSTAATATATPTATASDHDSAASKTTASQTTTATNTISSHSTKVTTKTVTKKTTVKASAKTTSKKATPTTTRSTETATPTPEPFNFVQLFDSSAKSFYSVYAKQFANTSFDQLCPTGDCIKDCQDYPRLFSSRPSGLDQNPNTYGRPVYPDNKLHMEMTFFGLCSNLGNATAAALALDPASKVHRAFASAQVDTSDSISHVANTIASCFASTCEATRDPTICQRYCAPEKLLAAGAAGDSLDITGAMLQCSVQLCNNTCGLPYADQDVLGIGVLVSYYTQALLVLVVAAGLVGSVLWRYFGKTRGMPDLHWKMWKPLDSFVTAQAYFGISAMIASFVMKPSTIDPLNGYALLTVSITGFLPVVFTLMLLHSHGIRSWFTTALVFASWLLSTIVFFTLFSNLVNAQHNTASIDASLQTLFHTSSCSGSSAMTLCQQLHGDNPLNFLMTFFNQSQIPNIKTVPLLWGWSTLVLAALVVTQAFGLGRRAAPDEGLDPHLMVAEESPRTRGNLIYLMLLILAIVLFSLGLVYHYVMVNSYRLMDVIDYDGWSFGQVVAVLFWAPPMLEIMRSLLGLHSYERSQHLGKQHIKDQSLPRRSAYTSLAGQADGAFPEAYSYGATTGYHTDGPSAAGSWSSGSGPAQYPNQMTQYPPQMVQHPQTQYPAPAGQFAGQASQTGYDYQTYHNQF